MYLLRKMVLAGLLFSAGVNMFAQESAYAYDANGNLTKDLNWHNAGGRCSTTSGIA